MKLSKNFSLSEFTCKCCGHGDAKDIDPRLLGLLEAIKKDTGRPVIINSGLRCAKNNSKSGGKPGSKHLIGNGGAADIRILDYLHKYDLIASAIRNGAGGIGIAETFIHVDVRPLEERRVWKY